MATTLTVTDLAAELGTDPRTARKFLRSITALDEQPGKGGRWGIPKAKVRTLRSQFTKFTADADAKAAEREAAKAADADEVIEVEDDAEVDA